MKTQLLEDIGESATLSLVPSGRVANTKSHQGVPDIAQARAAAPVRPRSAFGVWRQKPGGQPVALATQQPDQQPAPLEAPTGFEPIAAVEAQPVPSQPVHEAAIPPAAPTLGANPPQSETAPPGPVFDFTPPLPTTPAPDLFKREPSWFKRSGRRYLLWGSCVLSGALIILAGLWSYAGRKDASVLALVADESKAEPQFDKSAKRRSIGAKEFSLGPSGEVQVAPAAFASSPSPLPTAAPTLPPLAMLEPDAATNTRLQEPPKPQRIAEQAPAAPLPKRVRRTARTQVDAASKPARARVERAPERQLARAPVLQAERKSEQDTAKAATLKACREHGYQPEQCVKRACSVTKYGFVCRGK